jgi:hypothetical protein
MSTLNVSNITDGTDTVATSYVVNGSAKVFVVWVTSAGVPSITASLNVSSITDINVGDAQPNFASAMADANFSVTAASEANTITSADSRTTAKFRSRTISGFTTYVDLTSSGVMTTVHGDLA